MTAVSVACVQYGSHMDDGQVNRLICAHVDDVWVAAYHAREWVMKNELMRCIRFCILLRERQHCHLIMSIMQNCTWDANII